MTPKIVSFTLFLSFLICYLEWGTDNSGFIFQLEYEFFTGDNDIAGSFMHPLILLPFLGQIMLLVTTILHIHKRWTLIGMLLLSPLVAMILLAGSLSLNIKTILSTLPFVITAILFIRSYRKKQIITPKQILEK